MKRCFLFVVSAWMLCGLCCASSAGWEYNRVHAAGLAAQLTGYTGESHYAQQDAAGPGDESRKMTLVLYYRNREGQLVPAMVRTNKEEGVAKAALRMLADSPELREKLGYYEIYPVLPQGTQVTGMTIRNGIARVDFNNALLEYHSKEAEAVIFSSIIYTLTAFDTVEKVEILIGGSNPGILKYGFDTGRLLGREEAASGFVDNAGYVMIE